MSETLDKFADLAGLLKPTSVAIIGASDDPDRIGGKPLRYLQGAGYAGAIYPVNPKRERVQGLTCYARVGAVPNPVDLAIVAVPANLVVASVQECADKGVKAAIIFSAGFAEVDEAGEVRQRRLSDIARESGMRILGPNCLGLYNASIGFFATFTSTLELGFPAPAGVGIVSQSGAYGSHVSLLAFNRGIGVRYWITTGNECDVELSECIAYMADDPDISVIVAYAEGVRNRDTLLDALTLARAHDKPVVFMKVGRSRVGAQAAVSHTAALAGSDAVYDAVLRQFGAHRAADTEELLDIAYACSLGVRPKSPRLGLLTVSGGVGIQMADSAVDMGLDVAPLPESAQTHLKSLLPYAATRNPVDATAQVFNDPGLIGAYLNCMLEDGGYDAIIAFFTFVAAARSMVEPLCQAVEDARARYPGRLIVLVIVASPEIVRRYEDAGCLVFEDPTRAVRAVSALHTFECSLNADSPREGNPVESAIPVIPEDPMDETRAKRALAEAGLDVVDDRIATSTDEAAAAARELGYPVAMKIRSKDIVHKTDVGGIRLHVDTEVRVREAFDGLIADVSSRCPDAHLDGVIVSPMLSGGVETVLGIHRDPLFGPVVMFGLGGILVEVLNDVTFRVAPFDEKEARRMVYELKGYALLDGARGRGPYDISALCTALVRLSRFAAANAETIESVDVNPFLVLPEGQGAVALDALIVARRESAC